MPPQGVNFNEHESESGITEPQAQNFTFLGKKMSKYICFISISYLPGARSDFRLAFWGPNDSLGALGGGMALWAPLDPPMLAWRLQCCAPFNIF